MKQSPPKGIKNTMLLNELIKDEKRVNKRLYSSGPYWNYKNNKAVLEIKKKGLKDFRGINAGVATSFADNLVLDVRNEFNIKGKIIGKIFSLPVLKKIFNEQLRVTKSHLDLFIQNQAILYRNNKNVQNLINKYKFENCDSICAFRAAGYLFATFSYC